jgi:hypothetical protein
MRETTMLDALVIYYFVATMRQAGYVGLATAALGAAAARYARLGNAVRRAAAMLVKAASAAVRRSAALLCRKNPLENCAGSNV